MAETPTVVMNEATGRFESYLDGETAFTEYVIHNGAIVLPHTVVPPAFEGKGVGSALAKAALGYARLNHLKVKPFCPFRLLPFWLFREDCGPVMPSWRCAPVIRRWGTAPPEPGVPPGIWPPICD